MVWRQRNDFCFRNVAPGTPQLIARIRARLRFYLPLFLRVFRPAVVGVFSFVNGVRMGSWVRCVALVFVSLFSFLLVPLSSVLGLFFGWFSQF